MVDDDEFAAIMEGIELEEPDDVIKVTELNDIELADLFANIRKDLLQSNQMTADDRRLGNIVSTEEGRSLHSLRAAVLTEMAKRGLR